jgi:hypothetical protein
MNLINRLRKLPEKIWKEEIFPSQCENYHGISLLNMAYKVFSAILLQRLQPIVETSIENYECGFRPQKSTSDHLHSVNFWKR